MKTIFSTFIHDNSNYKALVHLLDKLQVIRQNVDMSMFTAPISGYYSISFANNISINGKRIASVYSSDDKLSHGQHVVKLSTGDSLTSGGYLTVYKISSL